MDRESDSDESVGQRAVSRAEPENGSGTTVRSLVGPLVLGAGALFFLAALLFWNSRQPAERPRRHHASADDLPIASAANLPKDFSRVGAFRFTDQNGESFGSDELADKVWVASFIFTRCSDTCPMVTAQVAELAKRLPKDVPLVTFTVDPRYDLPDVLARYAEHWKADREQWRFLTTSPDDMYALLRSGFRVPVAENPDPARLGGELVFHTTRIAVVDRTGSVRGLFDARDTVAAENIQRKVTALLEESP